MSEPVRILIVEDAPTDFELAQREIRKAVNDCVFQQVQTRQDFLGALETFQPDLILSDYQMPRFDGMAALQLTQEHAKLTPFIIWTGTMSEDVAVECMKAGAVNYILKENIKRLGIAVAHALEERRLFLEHKQAEETIYNNEKRFRALIENGRDNISLLAVDGTLLWESPATIRSLDYAPDEFVGRNIFELIHPDDRKWISELYAKLLQEPGSRQDGDFRLRHRDGSWRWNEATVTNMLNEPGVNAIVANYRDITERKQSEMERQALLEIMQGLTNTDDLHEFLKLIHHTIARVIYAENFFVIFYNKDNGLFEEVYSVDQYDQPSPPSALEMSITSYVFRSGEPLLLTQALFDKLVEQGEVELVGTNSVSWLGAPLKTQNGMIGVIVVQDYEDPNRYTERDKDFLALIGSQVALAIERKQAEDRLNYHARLLRHINDAVIATDDQFHITAWNRAAEKLYGWTSKEVMGHTVSEILNYELSDEQQAEARELLNESIASRNERIYRRRDGRAIYVEANTIALINQHGRMTGYVSVDRDISERKQAERALREHEQQLSSIYNTAADVLFLLRVEKDESYRFISVNQSFLNTTGLDKKQVVGKHVSDVIPEPALSMVLGKYSQAIQEKRILRWEETSDYPKGRLTGDVSIAPVFDETGSCTQLVGAVHDITERKLAEEQIQLQLRRLKALHAIDTAISSSFNLGLTLDILLDQVIAQLETDAAAILLFRPITRTLEYGASRGFRSTAIREARVRLGEGYAGKAILERRMIHIPNLMGTDSEFSRALLLRGEDFNDYYCVPLIVKGEVKGVLEIFHRSALAGGVDWLDFLETLAGQAAIAIQDATQFENLQDSNRDLFQAYDATIEGWSHALDLRDKETEGHSLRVTEMTLELARKFGFPDEQLIYIRWGALLHDIGKMGIPDNILFKPDKLSDEEWESMKKHPVFAFEMLSPITYLKSSLDIPYCHHEKWDGTGYPRGLKGEVIPLAARLFAVVDVWDALRSDRPYRKAWTIDKTLDHIKSLSGTHFDPKATEYFLELIGRQMGKRVF
jgi:PAS domain S-box-containing protein/putative nucleotidyltransferase with HDIG domain